VFVVASGSGKVKRIAADGARTVTTIAGVGPGALDGGGDVARMGPQGGAAFAAGKLLVSDGANARVRAIAPGADAAGTTVWTLAGSGAGLEAGAGGAPFPLGLAVGPDGRLYVADATNGSVRSLDAR
jgi:hypothetical protein